MNPAPAARSPGRAEAGNAAYMRSVWGDVFEVAVKRGLLCRLVRDGRVPVDAPWLAPWRAAKYKDVLRHCMEQSQAVDANASALVTSYHDHLSVLGYGIGWTLAREWWRRLPRRHRYAVAAVWCPLESKERRPGREAPPSSEERHARGQAFAATFGLSASPDGLASRGAPANADFLALLEGRGGERRLLCLEFSLNVPAEIGDFGAEEAHAREISDYTRLVGARGVFSNLAAEVEGTGFTVSDAMVERLLAFTGRDKPLYKLMQGCSYAALAAAMLPHPPPAHPPPAHPAPAGLHADVVAVTAAGIEAINAPMGPGSEADAKRRLLEALGRLYRGADDGVRPLDDQLEGIFRLVRKGLPRALRKGLDAILTARPARGAAAVGEVTEEVTGFLNPNGEIARAEALGWLDGCGPDVARALGGAPREVLGRRLDGMGRVTLRALNEAATAAAVEAAPAGRLTVLGLLGHPGVGKTTSLVKTLSEARGCLFGYFSPRVVINADVTRTIVERCGPGTLAVTTNHALIEAAPAWAKARGIEARVTGAVVVEAAASGVATCPIEAGGCLHLTPEQGREAAEGRHRRGPISADMDERTVRLDDARTPGVLRTLAAECRRLMHLNPGAPVVALTAAVQGFRATAAGTTVAALARLFEHKPDRPTGVDERRAMAARRPLVVVMIDEITGDGAGAPMVHAVADWLRREFLQPFGDASPFRVVLILADASLSSPAAFRSYLDSAAGPPGGAGAGGTGRGEAPQRLMVTPGTRGAPFGLAGGRLRLGERNTDILHVMADAYPAGRLHVDYAVRLDTLDMTGVEDGDARRRLREEHGKRLLEAAAARIARAADAEPDRQVVYFAQDKAFLGNVRHRLVERHGFSMDRIAELHGSVDPMKRRLLVHEDRRDAKRVFLMTSAGSRGVSFPKATTLIIQVPRFDIEASLMEVAQMVFRGRGEYKNPADPGGEKLSGDGFDRRIVFMVEDFVRTDQDGALDPLRWARQKIDLAGLVLLLRATLETRIKGRCADGFRGAVVPVGQIGLDVTANTMAMGVQEFLKECRVACVAEDEGLAAVARAAQEHAGVVFRGMRWDGVVWGRRSFACESVAVAFRRGVNLASAPLVGGTAAAAMPEVPDHAYFVGPTILEDWGGIEVEEMFGFGVGAADDAARAKLVGCCLRLREDAPRSLARAAADVLAIIARKKADLRDVAFSAHKHVEAGGGWVVLPADHSRFIADRDAEREGRQRALHRPEEWAAWMRSGASLYRRPTNIAPVVPEYDDKPFAAAIVSGDPTGFDRAFDNRYFMSTTEFNLLNALLYPADGG